MKQKSSEQFSTHKLDYIIYFMLRITHWEIWHFLYIDSSSIIHFFSSLTFPGFNSIDTCWMLSQNLYVNPYPVFKGTVSRDFQLRVFFMNQFPPSPYKAVSNFSKICGDIHSSRCTTGVIDSGGKWKKSSNIKVLIICLDTFGKES